MEAAMGRHQGAYEEAVATQKEQNQGFHPGLSGRQLGAISEVCRDAKRLHSRGHT